MKNKRLLNLLLCFFLIPLAQSIWAQTNSNPAFMLSANPSDVEVKPWSQIYSESKDRIPVIFSSGRVCSGALIESNLVLTAAHCVATLREIFIFWKGDYSKASEARVISIDRKNDLAILEMSVSLNQKAFQLVSLEKLPLIGEEVVTIGHPTPGLVGEYPPFDRDSTYLLSKGIISQSNAKTLISDLSVSPGNSGGPALNARGEIIGVVSRKRIDRWVGNIAHLVGPQKVSSFVEESRSEKRPISLFQAQTNLGLMVWYNHWSTNPQRFPEGQSNVEWELYASFWDRMVFTFSDWLGGDVRRESAYFLGWKFQFTTPRLTIWNITPGLSQWHYEGDPTTIGYSLILDHSTFPVNLKITTTSGSSPATILSFGLRLF